MEERKILTPQSVQQDLDALGQYKTADVDRLIRRYVKEQADAAPLREHILTEQQFHRIYYYVNLQQIKDVAARMVLFTIIYCLRIGGTRIKSFGMWRRWILKWR